MKDLRQDSLQILKKAYEETDKRDFGMWQPILSTKAQIKYCIDALLNKNDRARLKDIMFYQYAVHEFETEDPEYAELLHKASAVVTQMINGNI